MADEPVYIKNTQLELDKISQFFSWVFPELELCVQFLFEKFTCVHTAERKNVFFFYFVLIKHQFTTTNKLDRLKVLGLFNYTKSVRDATKKRP